LPRSLGLILLGLALGALATWAFQAGFHSPSTQIATGLDNTSDAAAQHNTVKDAVHALGTLEPAGGAVLVSSPLAGTPVKEIMVHEGQIVAAGQNLIQLDDTVLSEDCSSCRLSGSKLSDVSSRKSRSPASEWKPRRWA